MFDINRIHNQYMQMNADMKQGSGNSEPIEHMRRDLDSIINTVPKETQIISGTKSLRITKDDGPLGLTYNILGDGVSGANAVTPLTGGNVNTTTEIKGVCWKVGTYSYNDTESEWELTNTEVFCGSRGDFQENTEVPSGDKVTYAIKGPECQGDGFCDKWAKTVELPDGSDFTSPKPGTEGTEGEEVADCSENDSLCVTGTCEEQTLITRMFGGFDSCENNRIATLNDLSRYCTDLGREANCGYTEQTFSVCTYSNDSWIFNLQACCCSIITGYLWTFPSHENWDEFTDPALLGHAAGEIGANGFSFTTVADTIGSFGLKSPTRSIDTQFLVFGDGSLEQTNHGSARKLENVTTSGSELHTIYSGTMTFNAVSRGAYSYTRDVIYQ